MREYAQKPRRGHLHRRPHVIQPGRCVTLRQIVAVKSVTIARQSPISVNSSLDVAPKVNCASLAPTAAVTRATRPPPALLDAQLQGHAQWLIPSHARNKSAMSVITVTTVAPEPVRQLPMESVAAHRLRDVVLVATFAIRIVIVAPICANSSRALAFTDAPPRPPVCRKAKCAIQTTNVVKQRVLLIASKIPWACRRTVVFWMNLLRLAWPTAPLVH